MGLADSKGVGTSAVSTAGFVPDGAITATYANPASARLRGMFMRNIT